MKLNTAQFRGMMPIIDNTQLPTGYASKAINTRLVSGSLQGYYDIGNPFQLAKPAPIFTLEQAANDDWLQFYEDELASFAFDIRCVPGPIPADPTGRRYITGYNALTYGPTGVFQGASIATSVPQFTNTFYATDPSQQGTAATGAYPYKTFPLGVPNPLDAPTVTVAGASGLTTVYDYAQENSVNNATVVLGGTGYSVGDTPTILGGTYPTGFTQDTAAATITVTSVDPTGAITGLTLLSTGVYTFNHGPGTTAINQVGLTLPTGTITLASTAGLATSGSFTVTSSVGIQTVAYTGISGSNLTGCTGGTGTVMNGALVQATVAITGGSGSGATLNLVVVQNSFAGWATPEPNNGAGYFVDWQILNNQFWWAASGQGDLAQAYSLEAFNLQGCSSFSVQADVQDSQTTSGGPATDLIMSLTGTFNGISGVTGSMVVLSDGDRTFSLINNATGSNGGPIAGTIISQVSGLTIPGNVFYRIKATCTANSASAIPGFSVVATYALASAPTAILGTVTGFIPYSGEQIGIGTNHRGAGSDGNDGFFENIIITVTEPASSLTEEFTNYLVAYDQQIPGDVLTQLSGPSDPSMTVAVTFNPNTNPATRATATIVMQPVPAGEFIAYEYLYRLVEDASGNETYTLVTVLAAWNMTAVTGTFTAGSTVTGQTSLATAIVDSYSSDVLIVSDVQGLFQQGEVIEQDVSNFGTYSTSALDSVTITYDDSAQDTAIGPDVLISQDWLPPPPTLQGIVALPNGIMAGFYDNVLCLSAQGFPHAWPIANQYSIDTIIKAALPIDTTMLILDEANPYTAWGTDPSAFSMSKEVSNQGCTSTRGAVTHKTYGVVFPSGNGIAYYRGQGQLDLIRIGPTQQPPFSYEQWRALTPSSIQAVMHDDNYFFWYDNGSTKSGFVLDLIPTGFGLHGLDFHVTESYVDQSADLLYLTPDFSVYSINGSVVASAENIVSEWEFAATMRPRVWERDEMLLPRPAIFSRARVRYKLGSSADTINLTVSSEEGTEFNGAVAQQSMFVIGDLGGAIRWNETLTVTGEAVINSLELSETAADMLGDVG